jgi:hypothetical protein
MLAMKRMVVQDYQMLIVQISLVNVTPDMQKRITFVPRVIILQRIYIIVMIHKVCVTHVLRKNPNKCATTSFLLIIKE